MQFEGQVANFVEEERPLMGQLQAPEALREGACEGTFLVAEEFAFQQAGRDGGAVERDKVVGMTRAEAVQGARQEFFAGASLTLEEHGGIGWRHKLELREHRRERGAVPEDPVEAVLGVDDLAEHGSCSTLSVSSVAALVPVEFLHSRSHNVTPSELRRHACDDTSTKPTAMLPRVAFE